MIILNKCYAYARVSTDNESQDSSYEGQINYFKSYCDNNDLELVKVYSDRESGTSVFKRTGLLEMLDECGVVLENNHFNRILKDTEVDTILIKNTSRLSRNLIDAIEICRLLKENNINVIFIENQINTKDTSSTFMLSLLQLFDEQMSRDISSKVKQGYIMHAKTENKIHSNSRIYGYEYVDRRLKIIPDEAKVVQLIYSLYINGYGVRRILNVLREHNIKTRQGKEFGKTTIINILTNEKYYGCNNRLKYKATGVFSSTKTVHLRDEHERQYKDTNDIEPIISKEQFDEVQLILESKRGNRRGIHRSNSLYAEKIICGKCNSSYTHNTDRGRSFYNCKLKKQKGLKYCDNKNISESKLDNLINSDYLINELQSIKLLKTTKIYRSIKELESVLDSDNKEEINKLENELQVNTKKQEQLLDLYLNDLINKDIYSKRLNTLQTNYNDCNQRITQLKGTSEQIQQKIDNRKQLISAINKMQIKQTYNKEEIISFISKIVINDNTLTPYIVINGEEFEGSNLEMY